jgi:transcriptional regulator with XRE-family HTH domain
VQAMREAQGESMEAFAKRMKVALNTVSRWENSAPPRGKTLEKLYRFAKRNGPANSAEILLRAITREKSEEFRRWREAQILDAGNVQDLRVLLRELCQQEHANGELDPIHNRVRRDYLLKMADLLCIGGRKEILELLGETE